MSTMKNKYIIRSRISEKKFREILKYFAEDIEASKISNLTKISEATLCKIFREIRIIMSKECEKISKFSGEIEIDESYFGSKRVRGKRGRGASGKQPVFGMLKRDGKVYTQIVKNCSANELIPILSEFSELDESVIYSDCWKAYDGLVDYGAKAHYRVKHSKNEFANGKNHINSIENFWGYAKHRLAKFKGIKKENFLLHLKECEFRYNTKTTQENLYQKLLKLIRENPLKFNWAKLNTGGAIQMILEKNIDMVSERAILLMALGSLQALGHKVIIIDEIRRILFPLYLNAFGKK